jgi:hypothetical protein
MCKLNKKKIFINEEHVALTSTKLMFSTQSLYFIYIYIYNILMRFFLKITYFESCATFNSAI